MIKPYITELDCRVQVLNQIIGDVPLYSENSKKCKEKLDKIVDKFANSKDNKDVNRKYQKIAAFVQRFGDSLDCTYTADKVNIVVDELQNIVQTAQNLNKIEKLLPALDTTEYTTNRQKFDDVSILNTYSKIKNSDQAGKIQIVQYDGRSLQELKEQQQKQINSIMELNYRMINNLNQKLKLAYNNRK